MDVNHSNSQGSSDSGDSAPPLDIDVQDPAELNDLAIFFFYSIRSISAHKLYRMVTESEGPVGIPFKVPELQGIAQRLMVACQSDASLFYDNARQLAYVEHGNLGHLIGCYSSSTDRLIIYEDFDDGLTLHNLLHNDGPSPLNWKSRLSIAKAVASALHHLHQNFTEQDAPHGNLNSSTIIIRARPDGSYRQKLISYGFIRFLPRENLLQMAASRSPEVVEQMLAGLELQIGPEADVYCMGLVFLELLTGANPNTVDMWLLRCIMEKMMIDEGDSGKWIQALHYSIIQDAENHRSMLELLQIAIQCTRMMPELRDEMSNLNARVQGIA